MTCNMGAYNQAAATYAYLRRRSAITEMSHMNNSQQLITLAKARSLASINMSSDTCWTGVSQQRGSLWTRVAKLLNPTWIASCEHRVSLSRASCFDGQKHNTRNSNFVLDFGEPPGSQITRSARFEMHSIWS